MTRPLIAFVLTIGVLLSIVSCSSGQGPDDRFVAFAHALQTKNAKAAADLTSDPAAAEPMIAQMFEGMGQDTDLRVGTGRVDGAADSSRLTYAWSFGPGRDYGYDTTVTATGSGADAKINWSPSVLQQDLQPGLKFQFSEDSDLQVPVVDRDGMPVMSWQTVGVISLARDQEGSAGTLAGVLSQFDDGVTAESIQGLFAGNSDPQVTVMRLRAPDLELVADQLAGIPGVTVAQQGELLTDNRDLSSPAIGGLPKLWHDMVTKAAGWSVTLVQANGEPSKVLTSTPHADLGPVRTTLDLRLQALAQQAVAQETRPTVMVAISGTTGGILLAAQNAAANAEGPIAFSGLYPPGSTFKTITTAAAISAGLAGPDTPEPCPARLTIGDRTIPNDNDFDLGTVPLSTAFANSCNTTMGSLADRLPPDALSKTALDFGIGADYTIPGLTTVTGRVPDADTPAQRVENGIGQGNVTASPFGMAVAEASLAHGSTILPTLVVDQQTTTDTKSVELPKNVVGDLRTMMRQTVTDGTATSLQDIAGLGGKTGTAEFGDNANSHGWFVGIVDDIAFATLVVGGGSSAPAVAVSGNFLRPALAG